MKQWPHRQPDDPRRPGKDDGPQRRPHAGPLVEFKPVGLGAARVRLVADLAGRLSLSARYLGSAGVAQLLAEEETENYTSAAEADLAEALFEALPPAPGEEDPSDDEPERFGDGGLEALLDAVLDAALDNDLNETLDDTTLEDTMIEAMDDTFVSDHFSGPAAAGFLADPFNPADDAGVPAPMQAAFDEDEDEEFDEFADDEEEFDDDEEEDDEFDDDEDDDEDEEDDLDDDDEDDDLDDEEEFDDED